MKKPIKPDGFWGKKLAIIGQRRWFVEIIPLTFARARIIVTDGKSVEDSW